MRLFVKVTPLMAGTSDQWADAKLLECPADVEPDTVLSFLTQRLGALIDTAWTSTERHARLAAGWIFPSGDEAEELLCVPLVEGPDGSFQSMFELLADQRAEFDELLRTGKLDDYTVATLPQRTCRPERPDGADDIQSLTDPEAEPEISGSSSRRPQRPERIVSSGGGHRHARGRAGATEFPASWSDDQVTANIISVARSPDRAPVKQPNRRWRVRGTREGVEIMVIIKFDGSAWSAWPLPGGQGVQQNPHWSTNPNEVELARNMQHLPSRFADRLDRDDIDGLRAMAEAGEWAEEIDLLIAVLASTQRPVTALERHDLADLLTQLDMPADQLANVPSAGI